MPPRYQPKWKKYENVYWDRTRGYWKVQFGIDGLDKTVGTFLPINTNLRASSQRNTESCTASHHPDHTRSSGERNHDSRDIRQG